MTINLLLLNVLNVHTSQLYVQHLSNKYPIHFNISEKCDWDNNNFDFNDYKPESFQIITRMLAELYSLYGIKSILRDGSLLHTFRQIKTDMDMDIYMIIPKNMTFGNSYSKIIALIDSKNEYQGVELEYQNIFLMGLFWDRSDSVRLSYNGIKITDINVLHETFLNDPELQTPCLEQMECDYPDNDTYIQKNYHHIKTKNLFGNLCKCQYMDSQLFCFNFNAEKYLEIRYGSDFRTPIPGGDNYSLVYERPLSIWRFIIRNFPILKKFKRFFEGHQNEPNQFSKD